MHKSLPMILRFTTLYTFPPLYTQKPAARRVFVFVGAFLFYAGIGSPLFFFARRNISGAMGCTAILFCELFCIKMFPPLFLGKKENERQQLDLRSYCHSLGFYSIRNSTKNAKAFLYKSRTAFGADLVQIQTRYPSKQCRSSVLTMPSRYRPSSRYSSTCTLPRSRMGAARPSLS